MKNTYLILFSLLQCICIFSQEKISNEKYINYFQNTREIPFLHLNKTSFLEGEEIWFKAYIQEQNSQKLHPTTSNLYVSIFNIDGTLKDQQLIHIKTGIGQGNIKIDSSFTSEVYYLKASTKWMKNFKEDNAYYQKIKIVKNQKDQKVITATEKEFFDFQLLPEGGHILSNTVNNIGILIKDHNNKGVSIKKGIIKDQNNQVVRHFTTNAFGMNSIRLFIRGSEKFTFTAILENGTELTRTTTFPEKIGVSLLVNSKNPNKIGINILTNSETLSTISGKQYRVLLHNTRSFRNYPFTFNKNSLNQALILSKKEVNPGINIITLFNEKNKPIAERIFFINAPELKHSLTIEHTKNSTKDSLQIRLLNPSQEKVYASISFLPEETKTHQPSNNIVSTFLLQPYIKGSIQNPELLLGKQYRGQQRNIDLVLLTQGWSKYNWNSIFNKPPKALFEFENGIHITAKTNKSLTEKQSILLSSKENQFVRVITHEENPWILENSFLKKNSTLKFGLSSNQNYYKITPAISYTGGILRDEIDVTKFKLDRNLELEVSNFKPLKNEYEDLDEVEVEANKRRAAENEKKIYGFATMLRSARLENRINTSGETVIDFLRSLNYGYNSTNKTISPRGIGVGGMSRNFEQTERFGRPLVRVFLDGQEISNATWLIEGMYLDRVKEIFFGRIVDFEGEQIHIFRYSPTEYVDKKANFSEVILPIGFATEKEYYNPIYPSFFNETYKKYGAIFWKPNIEISKQQIFEFTIPSNYQKQIKVYIEGITATGKLISQNIVLNNN